MSILFSEGVRGRRSFYQSGQGLWLRVFCLKTALLLVTGYWFGAGYAYACDNNDSQVVFTYVQGGAGHQPPPEPPRTDLGSVCQYGPPANGVWWDPPPSPYYGGLSNGQTGSPIYPPTSPLGVSNVPNATSLISFWFVIHGIHYDHVIYYKWSDQACQNTSAAYCGETDLSQWKQALNWPNSGDTNNCSWWNPNGTDPTTSLQAAEGSPWNLPHGGHYYLWVYFKTDVCESTTRPISAVSTQQFFIPSKTKPVVTLDPSSGTFANSNAPANIGVTATGNADAQIDTATYKLTYDSTGSGSGCTPGQIVTSGNVDYPNAGSFQVPFNPFGGGPACGAGDYHLKVSVTDTGMANTTVLSTYTIVDLTPPAFSGISVGDFAVSYTWTASTAQPHHFDIMLNDPSGNGNPAYPVVMNLPPGTTSYTVSYNSVNLPPWWTSLGTNIFSSATLKECIDAEPGLGQGCNGFGTSNVSTNYTWADAAASASQTPFVSSAAVTWDTLNNLFPDPIASPFGTHYQIIYTTDSFVHVSTWTATPKSRADLPVNLLGLTANTPYQYFINSVNGDFTNTTVGTPVPVFWTLPDTPGTAPYNITEDNRSITATFNFANNPLSPPALQVTNYVLQAQISDFSQNPITSANIPQGTPGSPVTATVSSLNPGSTYLIRACAKRNDPTNSQNTFFCGPFSNPITTNINGGVLIPPPTATSLTAQWTLTAQSNVLSLQVLATAADGSQTTSAQVTAVHNTNPYTITVNNLPTSNTSYTLVLQHNDDDGNGGQLPPVPYPGSDVAGLTLAAVPGAPKLYDGGNAANGLTLTVTLSTDTNSSDSLYAIEITPPSGGVVYMQGDGTVSSTMKSMTAAQWAAANTTIPVASNVTYQARVIVQQKYDGGTQASAYSSITTPGLVTINSFAITSGVTLDGIPFGVPTGSPLVATFNVPIDTTNLTSLISISSGTGSPVPANWVYTLVNGPTGLIPTLSITPPGSIWASNTAYQVIFAQGVKDIFGFASVQSTSTFFVTAPPLGAGLSVVSSVVTPLDPNRTAVVGVPGTSLPVGGFVVPRVQFINPPMMAPAGSQNLTKQGTVQILARAEVDIYRCNANIDPSCGPANSDTALTVTLTPRGAGPALYNAFDKSTVGLYVLGPQGNLVMVPNSKLNADGSVSAPVTQSALYFLAGAINTEEGGAFAFPVPFKPASGHTVITFRNAAADTTIKIYTIMGELVKQLQADGTGDVTWDVKNKDGDDVASGVYIYQIKNSYSEKRGKLIIIR